MCTFETMHTCSLCTSYSRVFWEYLRASSAASSRSSTTVFAIHTYIHMPCHTYQTYHYYYYQTVQLPNPRPTQPKKSYNYNKPNSTKILRKHPTIGSIGSIRNTDRLSHPWLRRGVTLRFACPVASQQTVDKIPGILLLFSQLFRENIVMRTKYA